MINFPPLGGFELLPFYRINLLTNPLAYDIIEGNSMVFDLPDPFIGKGAIR